MRPIRVLWADDYPDVADSTAAVLRLAGFDARACRSATEALREAAGFRPARSAATWPDRDTDLPGGYNSASYSRSNSTSFAGSTGSHGTSRAGLDRVAAVRGRVGGLDDQDKPPLAGLLAESSRIRAAPSVTGMVRSVRTT